MNPVSPVAPDITYQFIVYAKTQPEYTPLPLVVNLQGTVITQWKPSDEEIHQIMMGGEIKLTLMYAVGPIDKRTPLSPMKLEVVEPECGFRG